MGKARPRISIHNCARILMDVGARRSWLGSQHPNDYAPITKELNKLKRTAKDRLYKLITGKVDEEPVKTDLEVLKEVNDLTLKLAVVSGWEVTETGMLFMSQNPRVQLFWNVAATAYEHLTATEVHDAVEAYKEAHDPTKPIGAMPDGSPRPSSPPG